MDIMFSAAYENYHCQAKSLMYSLDVVKRIWVHNGRPAGPLMEAYIAAGVALDLFVQNGPPAECYVRATEPSGPNEKLNITNTLPD